MSNLYSFITKMPLIPLVILEIDNIVDGNGKY